MKRTRSKILAATAALSLSFHHAATAETWVPLALDSDWDLRIAADSALDFSEMFVPTDMDRRIRIGTQGELTENGGRAQRYLCAPLMFTSTQGFFPEAAEADELALQLERHGYNLVRIHYLDAALMGASDSTSVDYGFSPTQLERFGYLLNQLKLNDIRWMIDINTSQYGAYGELGRTRFPGNNNPYYESYNLKLDVHFDDDPADPRSAVNHWKGLLDRMINQPMPGGGSLLTDKATVALTLVNELGMNYNLGKVGAYPQVLQDRFMAEMGVSIVPPLDMNKPDHGDDWVLKNAATKMQRFLTRTEQDTVGWMKTYLSEAKVENGVTVRPAYGGIVTAYNNGKGAQSYASRFKQTLVSVHAYYDPADEERSKESLAMTSSYAEALPYVGYFGTVRVLDKPFFVDEHHHPYWSPYRRESGLAFPAYAAFQGYDGICRFANPVFLQYEANSPINRRKSLQLFNVGLDPVSRAGETLSALLFRRGDVTKALRRAPAVLTDGFMHNPWSGKTPAPYGFNRLALVTGVGSVKEDYQPDPLKDVDPFVLTESSLNGATVDAEQAARWAQTLASLKSKQAARGWPVNGSDAQTQRYVTDTGQIVLDAPAKTLVVKTPRTEATVFPDALQAPLTMQDLKVISSDGGALVAASSLDGAALRDSGRVLFIVATDARSTDAVFTTLSDGRVELTERGHMPVEVRAIDLRLTLKRSAYPYRHKLYALSLTGERIAELPLRYVNLKEAGGYDFEIRFDTANLKDALNRPRITTYFELLRE